MADSDVMLDLVLSALVEGGMTDSDVMLDLVFSALVEGGMTQCYSDVM